MAINGNNVLVQRKFTCPKQQRTHKDLCLALTKVKLSKLFDLIFSNLAISLNMCFGDQKNHLNEMVLLSTHNICFS